MNFGAAVSSGFRNYATFRGRACRSEFWWWALFSWLVSAAGELIDAGLGTRSGSGAGLVGGLVGLVLILPGLSVAIRRLHDIDRSGWWYLIVFTIIGIIPIFIWSCRLGTRGPNRFGPDPLGVSAGTPWTGGGPTGFNQVGRTE